MKKCVLALLLCIMLVCGLALPAGAETVVKDGIEVTLTTDKESYDSLDVIDARLTVRNTNGFDVENVSAQIAAPEGYALSGDDEVKIGELSAGEVQVQQASVRDVEAGAPNLPQTGDDSNGMLWSLLLFVSAAVLCGLVIRNPQAKRTISLFLCVAMVGTMVLDAVPVVAENAQDIVVSREVIVNGKPVTITGIVTYSENEEMTARSNAVEKIKVSGYKINNLTENVKVREGDALSFAGVISATDGARISAVQVFVYEANTEVPYSVGEKYYSVTNVDAETFDLADIPELTVGEVFGESDYVLTEKGRYVVMVYAGDTNGACFADTDPVADGDQGPAIALRVQMPQDSCDHSACEYDYELDDSEDSRAVANEDGITHTVESSYRRYCADCGKYLMNVWGSGTSEEHNMVDGRCSECGYSAEAMMLGLKQSIPEISFYSYSDFAVPGRVKQIYWEAGYSDSYIVNVKLLAGEPGYSDEEEGISIVLNQSQTDNSISFMVPDDAEIGKYIKVHVYGISGEEQTEAGNQIYLRVYTENKMAICDHESAWVHLAYVEYMQEDSEKHIAKEFYLTTCDECADNVNHINAITKSEPHTFDEQGMCVDCGYAQGSSCTHKRIETCVSTLYTYVPDYDTTAVSADIHCVAEIQDVYCNECNVLLSIERMEYNEPHEKNTEGKCVKCGYPAENDCSHSEVMIEPDSDSIRYEPCEDDEHMHNMIYQGLAGVCEECGAVVGDNYKAVSKQYHQYQDGVCKLCGYGENGEHKHQSDGGYVYLRDEIEEIPGDNSHHRVTAYIYETTCTICKEKYEVESSDGGVGRPAAPHNEDKHVFEEGICGGCGYKCVHPEKNENGETNYSDKNPMTVSLADNMDGQTHTHTYNVTRTCLTCQDSWTQKIYDPAEIHNIRELTEKGVYKYNSDEHWLEVPVGCSCGYRTGEVVTKDKAAHNPQVTTTYRYDPDGNVHQVWEIKNYDCVCGMYYDPEKILNGPSGHSDYNGDRKCDQCGEIVDSDNTYDEYYGNNWSTRHEESYDVDIADISDDFLNNLLYRIDNIAFETNKKYYGGIQHAPMNNVGYMQGILEQYNEYIEDEFELAKEYLKTLDQEGCQYTALASTIFEEFKNRENEFEETFGYPMYINGHLNFDAVLVDFYCYANEWRWPIKVKLGEKLGEKIINPQTKGERCRKWVEFCKEHGVKCSIPESASLQNKIGIETIDFSIEYLVDCYEKGYTPIVGLWGGFSLRNAEGDVVYTVDGGHAMVVTGACVVDNNPYIVVSSWGHAYLIEWAEFKKKLMGRYTVQYE